MTDSPFRTPDYGDRLHRLEAAVANLEKTVGKLNKTPARPRRSLMVRQASVDSCRVAGLAPDCRPAGLPALRDVPARGEAHQGSGVEAPSDEANPRGRGGAGGSVMGESWRCACGAELLFQVCWLAGGWCVGTWCVCGREHRDTDPFSKRETAEHVLAGYERAGYAVRWPS